MRLARDFQESSRLGLPVHAVREGRAEALSRRRFLAGAGTAAVAACAPRVVRAAAGGTAGPSIAIVGAGIAGLNCALSLADAGVASTVYESSGRIGGRMFSNSTYWDDDQVSEWCGELIDTGHKTIQGLAKRFGLPLDDLLSAMPSGSEDTYYFFGRYYPAAQAERDFAPVFHALNADVQAAPFPTVYNSSTAGGRALDAMSLYDWIESRVPGGHSSPMGALLDVAYVIEYGAPTTDQSALNLVYLLGYRSSPGNFAIFGASDETFHIRGGNQRLPQAIAASLAGAVKTGYRLLSVARQSDGRVALAFQTARGTQTVVADLVVLALPFAVLRTLDLRRAGFDALKMTAIQELGRGNNGKLQLQFTDRLWNGRGAWPGVSTGGTYADTGYQATWEVSRAQPGASGILVDYTGGAGTAALTTKVAFGTLSSAGVSKDAARFRGQIEPVFPGLSALWNGKASSSIPAFDPNFLLAYSYWRVGQYQSFAGYERVAQGNVFFAGEHCSIDFQGFMEGGAQEGARAALEVLAALGKHTEILAPRRSALG
jgi:monoamine oxidase